VKGAFKLDQGRNKVNDGRTKRNRRYPKSRQNVAGVQQKLAVFSSEQGWWCG